MVSLNPDLSLCLPGLELTLVCATWPSTPENFRVQDRPYDSGRHLFLPTEITPPEF